MFATYNMQYCIFSTGSCSDFMRVEDKAGIKKTAFFNAASFLISVCYTTYVIVSGR